MAVEEGTYALTSLERSKEHGGIIGNEHDVEIVHLIREVGSRMEQATGRHFLSRQYVHDGETLFRLNSTGGTELRLPEYPVTAVSVLKPYPTDDALTEGYDEDFIVDPRTGTIELVGGQAFSGTVDKPARGVVEITYTAGYLSTATAGAEWFWGSADIGAEIGLACTEQVVFEFQEKERGTKGVASISTEGSTVSYLARPWLPAVQETIDRYRSIALCL